MSEFYDKGCQADLGPSPKKVVGNGEEDETGDGVSELSSAVKKTPDRRRNHMRYLTLDASFFKYLQAKMKLLQYVCFSFSDGGGGRSGHFNPLHLSDEPIISRGQPISLRCNFCRSASLAITGNKKPMKVQLMEPEPR